MVTRQRDLGRAARRWMRGDRLHRTLPQSVEDLPRLLPDRRKRARALRRSETFVEQRVERVLRELPESLGRVGRWRHRAFEHDRTDARPVLPDVLHRQARPVRPADQRELRVLQRDPDRLEILH